MSVYFDRDEKVMQEQGWRIKIARRHKGLTQTELGKAIGYADASTIHKIEKGKQNLPYDKVDRLCNVLKVNRDYLNGKVSLFDIKEDDDNLIEAIADLNDAIRELIDVINRVTCDK